MASRHPRELLRAMMSAAMAGAAVACMAVAAAMTTGGPPPPPASSVKELMTRSLAGATGKEVRMITVEYVPGGASLPHRHNAQVFVYVLEGAVKMQVAGSPAVTLGPGQTFYEGPDDVHTVSANASRTRPARILVFIVKDVGTPVTIAVPAEERQ